MTQKSHFRSGLSTILTLLLTGLAALALLAASSASVPRSAHAQSDSGKGAKPTPAPRQSSPLTDQIIPGAPINMTIEDLGRIQLRYRDYSNQFFGSDAEGV